MITIDQAIHRARNLVEATLAAKVRAYQSAALLDGADPDDLDAKVEAYRVEASQALEAHLVHLRAWLVAELRADAERIHR